MIGHGERTVRAVTRSPTRRDLLRRGTGAAAALAAGPGILGLAASRAAAAPRRPTEVHLTFGGDPTSQMVVSWTAPPGTRRPRVRWGPLGATDQAELRDVETVGVLDRDPRLLGIAVGTEQVLHHARIDGLQPDRAYAYQVLGDGMTGGGTFRTAPAGRAPFRFTAFGDQGTGDPQDFMSAAEGARIVDQVEARDPLMHLHLGDLSYANINPLPGTRGPAWERFLANNARSARSRPWMPIIGNHEIEAGMGPVGLRAYEGRFRLPGNGSRRQIGHWYAFTAGSVRFVALNAEDWAYQLGGDQYLHGYSGGEQRSWLEHQLREARRTPGIDWVVVLVHHPVVSAADQNGGDLGIRRGVLDLLAAHDVDLVLSGHDHDYERSHVLGAAEPGNATMRPRVVRRSGTENVDVRGGFVHLVLGGGGTKLPTSSYDASDARGQQAPVFVAPRSLTAGGTEDVTWVAHADPSHPYGFAELAVDPGTTPGGPTRIHVTQWRVGAGRRPTAGDRFTLVRPRSDAPRPARRPPRRPSRRPPR